MSVRSRLLALLAGVVAVTGALAACAPALLPEPVVTPPHTQIVDAPSARHDFLVPEHSSARTALDDELTPAERAATAYLAAQPTAIWLTPEQFPLGAVRGTVDELTAQARHDDAALALVVYGLPERDCGDHSAGGIAAADYRLWVAEISRSLRDADDVPTVVVLEPDSLALVPRCGGIDSRAALLRSAVFSLDGDHVDVYLDGGHSAWLSPEEMAGLIAAVDVAGVARGFATNVSNHRSTADEVSYAHRLAAHLDGMHAIIDTSRNGATLPGSEWCNVRDAEVGLVAGAIGDGVIDTNLWIKPPGESDGTCAGGPPAGAWWPDAAVWLTDGVL